MQRGTGVGGEFGTVVGVDDEVGALWLFAEEVEQGVVDACGLDDGDAAVDAQAADVRQVADDGEVLSQFFVGKGERVAAAQDDFFYLRVCGEVGGDGGDFALAQCLAAAADVFFAEAEAAVHGADGRDFPQDAVRVAVYQRGQRRVGRVADGVGQFARGDGEFARVGDELGGDGVVRRVVHGSAHFVAHRVLVFGKQAVQGGGGEVGAPREFFRGHEGGRCVGFVAAPLPQVFTYA